MKKLVFIIALTLSQCMWKKEQIRCFNEKDNCEVTTEFFKMRVPSHCVYKVAENQAQYMAKISCDGYELNLLYGFSGYDLPTSPEEYLERNEWTRELSDNVKSNISIKNVIPDSTKDNNYIALFVTDGEFKTHRFEIPDSLMAYNFKFDSTEMELRKTVWNEKFAGIQIEDNTIPFDQGGIRPFVSLTIISSELTSGKLTEVLGIFDSIKLLSSSASNYK